MHWKIGSALRFSMFTDSPSDDAKALCEAFGGIDALLEYCKKSIDTVELHMIKHNDSPDNVLNAVKKLASYGIAATIHGTINEADLFFAPYLKLFSAKLQPHYNITVHPSGTEEDTMRMLKGICDRIENEGYPVHITLENQRIKGEKAFGICDDVTRIVNRISSRHLSCCFDFGHQLSNESKYGIDDASKEFISLVKHTHIHSMYEGRTHFPLDKGKALLEKNLSDLFEAGFEGVLSLELDPARYIGVFDLKDSFIASVEILRTAARQVEEKRRMKAFYLNEYPSALMRLMEEFEKNESCAVLVGHSGYLLKFGDTRIAVDVSPCVVPIEEKEKKLLLDWINGFDAFVLTHSHYDHYDTGFFGALDNKLKKFVPDFMSVDAENTVVTSDKMQYSLGNITIGFFESGHSLGQSIVEEYGFCIEYNGEKYLFPTDVRNYDFEYPDFGKVKMLFAHLWLGKGNALNLYKNGYVDKFLRYVNGFGAEKVYIAHLYDIHRTIDEMWSNVHYGILKGSIPDSDTFCVGDIIKL